MMSLPASEYSPLSVATSVCWLNASDAQRGEAQRRWDRRSKSWPRPRRAWV